MEIELLHRNNLRIAAARGSTLDTEDRPKGRLPDAVDRLLADPVEGEAKANRRDGLAFTERSRGDRRNVDVLGVGPVLQAGERVKADLGLVLAVQLDFVFFQPHLPGDVDDGQHFRFLGDFNVTLQIADPSTSS